LHNVEHAAIATNGGCFILFTKAQSLVCVFIQQVEYLLCSIRITNGRKPGLPVVVALTCQRWRQINKPTNRRKELQQVCEKHFHTYTVRVLVFFAKEMRIRLKGEREGMSQTNCTGSKCKAWRWGVGGKLR
jgi:hypothetical protein